MRRLEASHLVLVKAIELLFAKEYLQLFSLAVTGIVLVKLAGSIQ